MLSMRGRSHANSACTTLSRAVCGGPATGYASIAQLIDANTGSHVWAERYDRDLADIFAVQDEITDCDRTGAIGPAISQAEQQRALRRPPESLSAWEAYQRALSHWSVSGDLNGLLWSFFAAQWRWTPGLRRLMPCWHCAIFWKSRWAAGTLPKV